MECIDGTGQSFNADIAMVTFKNKIILKWIQRMENQWSDAQTGEMCASLVPVKRPEAAVVNLIMSMISSPD